PSPIAVDARRSLKSSAPVAAIAAPPRPKARAPRSLRWGAVPSAWSTAAAARSPEASPATTSRSRIDPSVARCLRWERRAQRLRDGGGIRCAARAEAGDLLHGLSSHDLGLCDVFHAVPR